VKINPRLDIDLNKIRKNTENIKSICSQYGIKVVGITKGCSAIPEVAQAMINGGLKILGDSRIENIRSLRESGIKADLMLIRIPMLSEVDEVIKWADISLNSEISVINSLSQSAIKEGTIHKIILMIDVGDLREGIMPEDTIKIVNKIKNCSGIKLIGIGTNFCCISGVMPSKENLIQLVKLADAIEDNYNISLEVISGGNTSVLKFVEDGTIPKRVNQLRIGVGILLGQDDARSCNLVGTSQDTFILSGEIIELKEKPSLPYGEIGRDAFGEIPVFQDLGIRKRAILALGKQDIHLDSLIPEKKEIEIVGASSDHLIIDITCFKETLKVGDEIKFRLNYPALLAATTSKYINKNFCKEEKK